MLHHTHCGHTSLERDLCHHCRNIDNGIRPSTPLPADTPLPDAFRNARPGEHTMHPAARRLMIYNLFLNTRSSLFDAERLRVEETVLRGSKDQDYIDSVRVSDNIMQALLDMERERLRYENANNSNNNASNNNNANNSNNNNN